MSHTITILLKPDSLYILNIRKTKTKTETKLLKRRGHQRRCGRLWGALATIVLSLSITHYFCSILSYSYPLEVWNSNKNNPLCTLLFMKKFRIISNIDNLGSYVPLVLSFNGYEDLNIVMITATYIIDVQPKVIILFDLHNHINIWIGLAPFCVLKIERKKKSVLRT